MRDDQPVSRRKVGWRERRHIVNRRSADQPQDCDIITRLLLCFLDLLPAIAASSDFSIMHRLIRKEREIDTHRPFGATPITCFRSSVSAMTCAQVTTSPRNVRHPVPKNSPDAE